MARPYTNREVERIQKMREDGLPYKIIAAKLGRSVTSVERRAQSSGIRTRRARLLTTAQITEALELHSKGVTKSAIARHFKVSIEMIRKLPGMPSKARAPRANGPVVGIELPIRQHNMLSQFSKAMGITKARIVREALKREFERLNREGKIINPQYGEDV